MIGNSNSSTDTLTFLEWKINKDTLIIVSEDDFLDYPFGCYNKLKDLSNEFKSLQYKEEFSIGVDGEKVKIHRFLNNNSYIKFYYIEGMYDGKKRYQIVSAKIYDQDILMLKNIHVGIDKSMFFSKIGSSISCKESSVKVIKIIWNLVGVWHYYNFKGNILTSIIIDTDYLLNKD